MTPPGSPPDPFLWSPPAPALVDRPASARMQNHLLGGAHACAADRELAAALEAAVPDVAQMTWHARRFLRRAIQHISTSGVRQYLDLGCGHLADGSSLHDILLDLDPAARVVHADTDPIAIGLAAGTIADTARSDRAAAIQADIAQPSTILDHPDTRRLLNLSEPVVIVAADCLQFVADPAAALAAVRDSAAPGSYLVISHPVRDARPADMHQLATTMSQAGITTYPRSGADIARLFTGFVTLPPSLIAAERWRPTDKPIDLRGLRCVLAGIARKPLAGLHTHRRPTP